MSKQPSVACLTLTPEDLETTAHASRHRTTRPRSPWRASHPIIGDHHHRAVKASPAGGLRPALTALPQPSRGRGRTPPRPSTSAASGRSNRKRTPLRGGSTW